MSGDGGVAVALITGAATLAVALLSLLGARAAQRDARESREELERREAEDSRAAVEAQAYERAKETYVKIVADLERQVDRVRQQLAAEQEISDARAKLVRDLHEQVWTLRAELADLRLKALSNGNGGNGHTEPPHPIE
jgi:ABC-type transport system involved in cytochrome bd biosynthesis fused ATPase/permease subunit